METGTRLEPQLLDYLVVSSQLLLFGRNKGITKYLNMTQSMMFEMSREDLIPLEAVCQEDIAALLAC